MNSGSQKPSKTSTDAVIGIWAGKGPRRSRVRSHGPSALYGVVAQKAGDGRTRTSFHCAHWTEDQTIKRKPPTTWPSCGSAVVGGLALKCECISRRRRMAICLPRLLSPSLPVAVARSVWPMIRQVAAQVGMHAMHARMANDGAGACELCRATAMRWRRDCMTAHGGFDFTAE